MLIGFSPLLVLGQTYIGKSKTEVKKELETWKNTNAGLRPVITELGTTTTLSFKDPGQGQVKIVCSFDKRRTCISEKTVTMSDSIRNIYLHAILEKKEYEWIKLNGNQYISRYEDKLMIEIPGDPKNYSVTVYRAEWTKDIYDLLLKK